MSFGNNIGFIFDQELLETEKLFSEDGYGSIIVETAPRAYQSHDKIPGMLELGRTTNDETISFENEQASVMLTDARKAREAPLAEIFPTENTPSVTPSIHINEKSRTTTELNRSLSVNLLTSPPKAVVLSFPGTNSELDTRHQLIKA